MSVFNQILLFFRIDTQSQIMRMSAVYMHLFRYASTQCILALECLTAYAHWQQ